VVRVHPAVPDNILYTIDNLFYLWSISVDHVFGGTTAEPPGKQVYPRKKSRKWQMICERTLPDDRETSQRRMGAQPAKVGVEGSNPFARSRIFNRLWQARLSCRRS
jgi:hypothetical protein